MEIFGPIENFFKRPEEAVSPGGDCVLYHLRAHLEKLYVWPYIFWCILVVPVPYFAGLYYLEKHKLIDYENFWDVRPGCMQASICLIRWSILAVVALAVMRIKDWIGSFGR